MGTMSRSIYILLLSATAAVTCLCQEEQPNVMAYFAVTNSLDGQPMADMKNVLRFFPVYAMRPYIESVRVTVYYGSHRYSRLADSLEDKSYWEALLPPFNLGEAIQRLEVEVRFRIKVIYSDGLKSIDLLTRQKQYEIEETEKDLSIEKGDFDKKRKSFGEEVKEIDHQFWELGITESGDANRLRIAYAKGVAEFAHVRDSLLTALKITTLEYADTLQLEYLAKSRSEKLRLFLGGYESFRSYKQDQQNRALTMVAELNSSRDSLMERIAKEIEVGLVDTQYTGPSIRKSDLIIEPDFKRARLLYRNYKPSLRYMPALDPAERMGIFRIRYVPFPIAGTDDQPSMNLKKPLSRGSPTVFEVGLAFGDAIVPGDDFVVPELSWRRLGIAFAITEQLFSDSAQIVGLALTYDFNSYGSIGIGGNFASKTPHGYASLGINKKAFEAVIKGLAAIFK